MVDVLLFTEQKGFALVFKSNGSSHEAQELMSFCRPTDKENYKKSFVSIFENLEFQTQSIVLIHNFLLCMRC